MLVAGAPNIKSDPVAVITGEVTTIRKPEEVMRELQPSCTDQAMTPQSPPIIDRSPAVSCRCNLASCGSPRIGKKTARVAVCRSTRAALAPSKGASRQRKAVPAAQSHTISGDSGFGRVSAAGFVRPPVLLAVRAALPRSYRTIAATNARASIYGNGPFGLEP
jgi:hypothetical protein